MTFLRKARADHTVSRCRTLDQRRGAGQQRKLSRRQRAQAPGQGLDPPPPPLLQDALARARGPEHDLPAVARVGRAFHQAEPGEAGHDPAHGGRPHLLRRRQAPERPGPAEDQDRERREPRRPDPGGRVVPAQPPQQLDGRGVQTVGHHGGIRRPGP
jgi:hypothetical protein